jgi:Fe-S-cluster containining protein
LSPGDSELVAGWVRAVNDAGVVADLLAVFASVTDEVTKRGPVCWASGRCCNFKQTGHLLYVTGLEAAFTLVRCGGPGKERLAAAVASGGCPFQVMNLCGVHGEKPLGCRLFFCDRTAQEWQNEVYERLLGDLRSLHARHGVEYRYGEWRGMLGSVMEHAELGEWSGGLATAGTHHEDDVAGGGGTRLTVGGK